MEVEAMGSHGDEFSIGYKLVPWSRWAQWEFVRDGLFSSSANAIAASLRRIVAWRSRGCLPIPVDVTAAFIEIQQKDPFFRTELVGDAALESEEMLAMLYSMAIVRLVNCFVEHTHKKTGRSISELAEAVGIPRVLVDIRHESSHRSLPSLRLLRLAAMTALHWLKNNYWEPQKNAIPDVQVEIRSRLLEMAYCLKAKPGKKRGLDSKGRSAKPTVMLGVCNKLSLQMAGKSQLSKLRGPEKHISKTVKYIVHLYCAYPSEVVSVLLDFFQLDAPESLDSIGVQYSDSSDTDHPWQAHISNSDLKTIITKLSSKEPRLLLSILKTVLEMIETKESVGQNGNFCTFAPRSPAELCKIKNLCSLVLWLVTNLKALKDSGRLGLVHEMGVLSSDRNAAPRLCLAKLLQKCLSLSVLGERYLIDAVLLLLEMIGNNSVKEKLKKLPLFCLQSRSSEDFTLPECKIVAMEEDSAKEATENLEDFKIRLKKHRKEKAALVHNDDVKTSAWTVTKSWIPCPIGMLPCSFSSTTVLPVLDVVYDEPEDKIVAQDGNFVNDGYIGRGDACSHPELLDDGRVSKRSRPSPEVEISDIPHSTFPLEGNNMMLKWFEKCTEEQQEPLHQVPNLATGSKPVEQKGQSTFES